VEKAKEALKGDDTGTINQARDELMQAFSAAGQEMYQAQAAQPQPESPGEPDMEDAGTAGEAGKDAGGDEEVVEADYEIVDEGK
jgi:molecular chaperone DnaK